MMQDGAMLQISEMTSMERSEELQGAISVMMMPTYFGDNHVAWEALFGFLQAPR